MSGYDAPLFKDLQDDVRICHTVVIWMWNRPVAETTPQQKKLQSAQATRIVGLVKYVETDENGEADCIGGDRNNSLEEATYLLWDESIEGYLNPDGDLFYTFSTYGQEYVRITTIAEFEEADTVVTLRDPLGKVVTFSDNFPTGSVVSSLDSVVYAYLAYEGEYLITVEDIGTHTGEDPYGHPSYLYTLNLTEWSQVTSEPDSFDDGPLSLSLEMTTYWNSVGVHIQSRR